MGDTAADNGGASGGGASGHPCTGDCVAINPEATLGGTCGAETSDLLVSVFCGVKRSANATLAADSSAGPIGCGGAAQRDSEDLPLDSEASPSSRGIDEIPKVG